MRKEKTKVKKMQKLAKNVKGITLIALVVTIIVLLILAGVAISLTIGQNGIFTRAQTAVVINENASVYEQLQLKVADYQMEAIETGSRTAILERLKTDGFVNEDNSLNVVNLMGRGMQTGNGSIETGDVYVLEQRQVTASSITSDTTESMDYYLIYYGENNSTNTNLGLAFEGKTEEGFYEPTDESYFEFDEKTGAIALKDPNSYYSTYGADVIDKEVGIKTIVVPSTYGGKTVTKIGIIFINPSNNNTERSLGINAIDVEKIILPNTITELVGANHGGALRNCKSLKEIVLSTNLKIIGTNAFINCISLKEITIPASVETIGEDVFWGCSSLEKITIKGSLNTEKFTREELGVGPDVEIIYEE